MICVMCEAFRLCIKINIVFIFSLNSQHDNTYEDLISLSLSCLKGLTDLSVICPLKSPKAENLEFGSMSLNVNMNPSPGPIDPRGYHYKYIEYRLNR